MPILHTIHCAFVQRTQQGTDPICICPRCDREEHNLITIGDKDVALLKSLPSVLQTKLIPECAGDRPDLPFYGRLDTVVHHYLEQFRCFALEHASDANSRKPTGSKRTIAGHFLT